jgi:hypothetical protein
MSIERVRSRKPLSADQRARNKAVHEFVKREKPGPDELTAGGKYKETLPFEAYMDFRSLIQALTSERQKQGLTLAELSAATGMDAAVLCRLETGRGANPTIDTLIRYATALGQRLRWGFSPWANTTRNGRGAGKPRQAGRKRDRARAET